jgi:hypothetical protein
VTKLRGAEVEVDVRRTTQIVVVASLVALAALVIALFAVDANKSSQIAALKDHGLPVDAVVARCVPQMSGSGSSVGGYDCTVAFKMQGTSRREVLLGTNRDLSGDTVQALVNPDDPRDVYPKSVVRATHRTWTAFMLPIILLVVLVGLSGLAITKVRSRRPRSVVSSSSYPSSP